MFVANLAKRMVNLDHLHLIKVKSPLGVFNDPPRWFGCFTRTPKETLYHQIFVNGAYFSFNSLWEFRVLLNRTQTDGSFLPAVLHAHTCHVGAPWGCKRILCDISR